jgi:chromosome segregation ATPase
MPNQTHGQKIDSLNGSLAKLDERIDNLRSSVDQFGTALTRQEVLEERIDSLINDNRERVAEIEKLRDAINGMLQVQAVTGQKIEDLNKRMEHWNAWAKVLVPSFLGVIFSLVVGLILIILRRTP